MMDTAVMARVVIGVVGFLVLLFLLEKLFHAFGRKEEESPQRENGRQGEQQAAELIRSVLREGDHLFTNVEISFQGRPAEIDAVVVNTCGVFVIEVKNYSGKLVGGEDDYDWKKYHMTEAGNVYVKTVKNPIKQMKRQVYLLAHYLEYYGVKVWVEGYAMLLHRNSPVNSGCILWNTRDIDRAVHTPGKVKLTGRKVLEISRLMEQTEKRY